MRNVVVGDDAKGELHQLLLFSGNDYLGLSVHPAVRQAAAQVQFA